MWQTCKGCGGKGEIQLTRVRNRKKMLCPKEECPLCDGTGSVSVDEHPVPTQKQIYDAHRNDLLPMSIRGSGYIPTCSGSG